MGEIMKNTNVENPFNNNIEYGLRAILLLQAMYPKKCDLDLLSYLDYIVVHSGDFDKELYSLHAPIPNRKNEVLIRRSLLEGGLKLYSNYCFVKPVYEPNGIFYELTEECEPFLDSLSEEYTKQVKLRAKWAVEKYSLMNLKELKEELKNTAEPVSSDIAFHISYSKEER